MSILKIGYVQSICSSNLQNNINETINKIKVLASNQAQIICLSEFFHSPYFCDEELYRNFEQALAPTDSFFEKFQSISAQEKLVLIISFFEKRTAGIYHNSVCVIDADGKNMGIYRKTHIPDDPNYYEKFYFTPGDSGFKVFKTKYCNFGVLICWDQWFPEAARITSLLGAEILFYPTAIGWNTSQSSETNTEQYNAWQTIQRSHAIANGVHVVSVNRTGVEQEGRMQFWGGSFVSNPFGTILYQSPHLEPDSPIINIDLAQNNYYRTHWPFLRDRRPHLYKPLLNQYLD